LIVSAIAGKPIEHMPMYLKPRYKAETEAFEVAQQFHHRNRSVTVIEWYGEQKLASWTMEAGSDLVAFECDEKLCAEIEQ